MTNRGTGKSFPTESITGFAADHNEPGSVDSPDLERGALGVTNTSTSRVASTKGEGEFPCCPKLSCKGLRLSLDPPTERVSR